MATCLRGCASTPASHAGPGANAKLGIGDTHGAGHPGRGVYFTGSSAMMLIARVRLDFA